MVRPTARRNTRPPWRLLRAAGVTPPEKIETSAACSDGACRILELGADQRGAAVISSYAKPLLEGCGTVKKGELRAIGETQPVPFITAFVSSRLPKRQQRRITKALLDVGSQPGTVPGVGDAAGVRRAGGAGGAETGRIQAGPTQDRPAASRRTPGRNGPAGAARTAMG